MPAAVHILHSTERRWDALDSVNPGDLLDKLGGAGPAPDGADFAREAAAHRVVMHAFSR